MRTFRCDKVCTTVAKSLARVGGTQEREGPNAARAGGQKKHATEGAGHDVRRRMVRTE